MTHALAARRCASLSDALANAEQVGHGRAYLTLDATESALYREALERAVECLAERAEAERRESGEFVFRPLGARRNGKG